MAHPVNFDALAPAYIWLERIAFGRTLDRARTAMLKHVSGPRRALLIGEGDGRFLATLRSRFPDLDVDVIEPSDKMIQLARNRAADQPASGRLRFFQQSVCDLQPEHSVYDLISMHFVLDVLTTAQVVDLVPVLLNASSGQAVWLVSEFSGHNLTTRAAIRFMYKFFALTAGVSSHEIPDYDRVFRSYGVTLAERETRWGGFIASELWIPNG